MHATAEEALAETERMFNIYADFLEDVLAIPVVKGRKTRKGEILRGRGHLHRGVHDARPQGPPGRHQPLLRRRLRQAPSTLPSPAGTTSSTTPSRPPGASPPV